MIERNTHSSLPEYRASVFDAYMNVRLKFKIAMVLLTGLALDAMGDMPSNVITLPFR